MTRIRILASLAFVLLISALGKCEGQLKSHWSLRHAAHRFFQETKSHYKDQDATNRLLQDDRHPTSVHEKVKDLIDYHPNPVTLRSSYYFTATYCSPDENGYYGSTMGTPHEIIFGFEAETAPNADVDDVVNVIHESVVTALLNTFFPTMCRKAKEPYDSHVTGFHFDRGSVQYVRSCRALKSDENICGIYVGTVRVYGEDSEALNIIRDHLDRDGTTAIHSDLRRLYSVDMDQQNIVSTSSAGISQGITSSAIVGLAVALVTLSIGIVGLVAIQMRRRRRNRRSQSSGHDFSSESERDESISIESVDLQVETVDFEHETALVVSGNHQARSVIIYSDLLSRESELL